MLHKTFGLIFDGPVTMLQIVNLDVTKISVVRKPFLLKHMCNRKIQFDDIICNFNETI